MALPSGTVLGSFVIDARLDDEGRSELYRAHQPALGRSVLIERLPHSTDRLPPELDRELRLRARLLHPNVEQIFDCFLHRGVTYLVREFVEGPSLAELLEAGRPVPGPVALQIGLEVARGLAEIHERGIVHGDLGPRNLRLSQSGETKITGFAKAREAGSSGAADPIDAQGKLRQDPRAGSRNLPAGDVFSLGRTLQELLTPTVPRADSRRFPGLSRQIQHALRASLLADPAQRPQARELRNALSRELGDPSPLDCRVAIATWLWQTREQTDARSREEEVPTRTRGRAANSGRRVLWPAGAAVATVALAGILWVGYTRSPVAHDVGAAPASTAPGQVWFVAHPWAEVQVDDLPAFYTPRAEPVELAPGEHHVVFRHPTLGSHRKTVWVRSGEPQRVTEHMEPTP